MNKNFVVFSALVLGASTLAQAQTAAPTKIAIINITGAILGTKDGQAAANALQAKFAPKKAELDKKQAAIAALREQLSKGSATMSQEARDKLAREIDTGTKAYNRDTEDAQADLDQEQGKIQQDLGSKVMQIVEQFAMQNGYAVVLDVANPQTPVLWAAASVDITNEIVGLYDKAHAQGAPAAAPKPATSAPAVPRPATPTTPPAAPAPPAPKKK